MISQTISRPISRAISQSLTGGASAPVDYPLTLGAALIAWLSPSSEAWWQDTAGTVAATDGDLLERIDDVSGNGHHMTRNGGIAAVYANTGYGTTAKCATIWSGTSDLIWAVASLDHETTNRRYYFATQDRGMHLDASLYKEVNGTSPDLEIQPSQTYGVPAVTCQTASDGASGKYFNGYRHMGYRNVWRMRFTPASTISSTDGLDVKNADFQVFQRNVWSTPTTIPMSYRWLKGFHVDLFDLIITDDTITDEQETALMAWMRERISEPTSFPTNANIALFGDSLTTGYGSSLRKGWPRYWWGLLGYEPRWAQLVAGGLTAFQAGNMTPVWNAGYDRNIAVVWLGTNDVYNFGRTAVQAQTALESIVTTALSNGADEVFVLTMIKRLNADGALEVERAAYNATIASRAATVGYSVIDVAARSEFSDTTNTTYYNADKVHITDAGQSLVAALVNAAVFPGDE